MKKILLFTENLGSGGAERQLVGLAVLLKKQGYDVKVITYLKSQFYENYLVVNKVPYELHENLSNPYLRPYRLSRIIRKEGANIVISFLPSSNITACISKYFFKNKLIVSERSYTQNINVRTKIQLWLYRQSDYVVTNSVNEANNLSYLYPKISNKIKVIHNFVDINQFQPSNDKEFRKNGVLRIIGVGRIIRIKNIHNLIDAVSIARSKGANITVHWYGTKKLEPDYYNELIGKINEYNLDDVFRFSDPISDIQKELREADVICLPSLFEGFPNVLCEGLSCGLPGICSNVCDNPLLIRNNYNGYLFDPLSVESIAEAILKIAKLSTSELKQMSERSRDIIVDNYDEKHFVNNFIELINGLG